MNISLKTTALILSVSMQIAILLGMYVLAALPLWTGNEVKVKTAAVDPRSLFRGNYALLQYDISLLERRLFDSPHTLRNGEVVYVVLKPGPGDVFTFSGVSMVKPSSGVFLRGRIEGPHWVERNKYFRINYGIEAFFAPKEKALALEKRLRHGGLAVLMVSADGKARIKSVEGV